MPIVGPCRLRAAQVTGRAGQKFGPVDPAAYIRKPLFKGVVREALASHRKSSPIG